VGDGLRSLWRRFWSPSARYSVGLLLIVGAVGGVVFWGGFNTFLDYTNKMEFCISCHEMRDIPYAEYKKTVHYQNTSGVRAICSDCHVPKVWEEKLWRKIKATFKELPNKVLGKIGTKEKYEAHRLEMAELDTQKNRAREQHMDSKKSGETCIDCHKGIAHEKPKKAGGAEEPGGFAL